MAQWGLRRRVHCISHPDHDHDHEIEDKKPLLSSSIEQQEKGALHVAVKTETLQIPEFTKRKRLNRSQLKEVKAALHAKQTHTNCKKTSNKRDSHSERWSAMRYKLAEKNMSEILKAEGATFQNPISRTALRTAARKCIGDTGLLDHLLKHLDGRVAPGGTERFRRWFNTKGVMEYWLENAELVNIRQQAGVHDPYWIPPSGSRPMCAPYEDPVSAQELKLLWADLNKMKSEMEELTCKKQEQYDGNQVGWQEMFKEMVKWKAETDQNLKVILSSWKSMQDMYGELITWKAKLEQQLVEVRSLLSSMQESQQHHASSPQAPEQWEDWLESTKLDDVQGTELVTWFDSTNLGNVEQEVVMQDLYSLSPPSKGGDCPAQDAASARELEQLKEEMIKINRDVQEFPKNQREDHANVTPDSSTTVNSIPDFHNSSCVGQEIFLELYNWKAKMEQELNEIVNSVNIIRQASNY
ncbi:DYAD protein [Parasponia andersonii]|uniref:DYAD protein n=1 Tax=Parasponia andersonii TaxID=3476 RepID=A0A2P5AGC5_PARAD|nr:DYAD protein [Parasponia andersonii]